MKLKYFSSRDNVVDYAFNELIATLEDDLSNMTCVIERREMRDKIHDLRDVQATPGWIQRIPVISTAHMPGPASLHMLAGMWPVALSREGGFLCIDEDPDVYEGGTAWIKPIAVWAKENEFPWVRFDSIGDVIKTLPYFEW